MSSSENKNRTCAIIPFFNEKNTLNEVVERTIPFVDYLILVDDGSNDGYLLDFSESQNIILLNHAQNLGKGAALQSGFRKAEKLQCDYIITLDADLQHEPEKLPQFVEKLKDFDVVIGSRMNNTRSMPFQRILSNKITSFLVRIKTGVEVYDSQSGFRGYKTAVITKLKGLSNNWGAETEMLIISAQNGARFGYVNIPAIYNNLSNSKMQPVRAIFQFLSAILKSYSRYC